MLKLVRFRSNFSSDWSEGMERRKGDVEISFACSPWPRIYPFSHSLSKNVLVQDRYFGQQLRRLQSKEEEISARAQELVTKEKNLRAGKISSSEDDAELKHREQVRVCACVHWES